MSQLSPALLAHAFRGVIGKADRDSLKESALESGKISSEEFDKRVRPERECSADSYA